MRENTTEGSSAQTTVGPRASPPAVDQGWSLDRSLVRGIAWTGAVKWLSQVLSWVSTIVVVRLLSPADYGLIGMATTYLALVTLINELGLGAAIITHRDLSEDQIRQINTVCVLLGLAGFLVSAVMALPLAAFFRAPDLRDVITVMSFAYLISGFQTVPSALLQRELRFRFLAVAEGMQSILQAAVTVLLAVLGFRYWAIVLGGVLGTAFLTIVIVSERRLWFARPRLRAIGHALTFSSQILVMRLSWLVWIRSDYLIIGRVLGQTALGVYSVASTLAGMPVEKITGLVGRVSFPLFSAVQHERASLRRYLLLLTEGLALAAFPLAFGLALVTDEFVMTVLGAKWADAILPLRILALLTTLRAIYPVVPQVLTVTGQAGFIMWMSVVWAVIAPLAFYGGTWWGITGIVVTWCVLVPLSVAPIYWLISKRLDLSMWQYVRSLSPALTACLAMAVAVLLIKAALPMHWALRDRFVIEVLVGATVYGLFLFLLHRDRLRSLAAIARPSKR
jgi:O-antigen/teichoic acid export membrane protein